MRTNLTHRLIGLITALVVFAAPVAEATAHTLSRGA